MRRNLLGAIAVAAGALFISPRAAQAGCIDSCDAITKITASFTNAPDCVTATTEPNNGCVCHGYVKVQNGCSFEITAQESIWTDGETAIGFGESKQLLVDETAGVGDHRDEHQLMGDGMPFTLVVDYTVAHVERDLGGGCSAGGAGTGAAGAGAGVAAIAALVARLRGRRRAARG